MPNILEESFANALHGAARAWRQALDRRLKDLGVSQASWLTIAVIARAPAPPSQIELANLLAVEGPTMAAMIDRLAKAGLVSRKPSSSDRRVKLVVLTKAGSRLYVKVNARANAFRDELLGTVDAGVLSIASRVLERLITAAESIR